MVESKLTEFLFPVRSTTWLAILRLGLGFQVVLYSFSLWADWSALFGIDNGSLIRRDLTEAIFGLGSSLTPRLGWLVTLGGQFGLTENASLKIALAGLLCSGACLILGLFSRAAGVTAWLLHLAAGTSGGMMTYGVDNFMTIGLFYFVISPLPDRYSLDVRLRHKLTKDSDRLGFHQRVLQLHLCLIYFFGGLAKCLGSGWWDGTSMWRALIRPPFNIIPPSIVIQWSYLLPSAGILICLLEIGYPIFIWPKTTRTIWMIAIVLMHLAIAVTMGMYLFALIMIVLNAAAFGPGLSWPILRFTRKATAS